MSTLPPTGSPAEGANAPQHSPPDHEAEQEALALAMASGLPYTGLRGFEADPRLFNYVPLALAVAARVVPIVIVGDTLKLASATPHPDVEVLRERFPALTVDIVLAPGSEIDLALARAQGAH